MNFPIVSIDHRMAPSGQPEAIVLLDASGSMEPLRSAAIQAINGEFLPALRAKDGGLFSLFLFNAGLQVVIRRSPVAEVPDFQAYPVGGRTRLHDAIVSVLGGVDRTANGDFVVVTDGVDNESTATEEQVRVVLGRARMSGWTIRFVELGVAGVAARLGVLPEEVIHVSHSSPETFHASFATATFHMTTTRIPKTALWEAQPPHPQPVAPREHGSMPVSTAPESKPSDFWLRRLLHWPWSRRRG